ncbi:hypothetical protein J4D99_00355 [Siccationidurans ginsengisoli]|uniref:hypothetical protein n=1 Tax=Hymenobacter TaxID=89966 RepID=UPI001AAD1F0F|nr:MULTISPECIES: hypothetical protein [unclassified Hymenobacter]MBO2029825.1 hypothetical protein [Hymenobacter sp. BT559]
MKNVFLSVYGHARARKGGRLPAPCPSRLVGSSLLLAALPKAGGPVLRSARYDIHEYLKKI